MPVDLSSVPANAANGAIGAIMGLALEKHNDKRQIKQQQKLTNMQTEANKQLMQFSMQRELEMWKNTGPQAQKEQLIKAGLNPGLLYGMSGAGGATTGSPTGSVGGAAAPSGGGEAMGMGIQMMQMQLMKAQKENIEADTANKEATTTKTTEADIPNVKADTALKIASEVIAKYTGADLKDTYERVKSPSRGVEAQTYQYELEARQGVAGTLYELWNEGKLKEKSVAEIEQLLLQNSKLAADTAKVKKEMESLDETIKGQKLDNIITELETKLQTETGVDRNSPTWMKILGRLFVTLFRK